MTPAELKSWRLARGLSAWGAAELLGVNYRTYQRLEAGVTSRGTPRPALPLLHYRAWRDLDRELRDADLMLSGNYILDKWSH